MGKWAYGANAGSRPRSAGVSAQSGQGIRCLLENRIIDHYRRTAKSLMGFRACAVYLCLRGSVCPEDSFFREKQINA